MCESAEMIGSTRSVLPGSVAGTFYGVDSAEMRELRGRIAVVTGGASGLGYGIAHALLGEGARVVLADLDEPALESAVRGLAGRGPLIGVRTDVASAESVDALRAATERGFGP